MPQADQFKPRRFKKGRRARLYIWVDPEDLASCYQFVFKHLPAEQTRLRPYHGDVVRFTLHALLSGLRATGILPLLTPAQVQEELKNHVRVGVNDQSYLRTAFLKSVELAALTREMEGVLTEEREERDADPVLP